MRKFVSHLYIGFVCNCKNRTMKRIVLFLICFIVLSFSRNKNIEEYNFIGKWKGIDDKGEIGYIIFEKDGTASMKNGDNTMVGGKDYYIEGKKATITYIIDITAKPISIDFIMNLEGHEIPGKLSFVAEIIDDNSFKVESIKENKSGKKNSMILTRIQE